MKKYSVRVLFRIFQAITQDGPKRVGLLANVLDRNKYEITAFTISNDYEGIGVPRLRRFVSDTLKNREANGSAGYIHEQWSCPTAHESGLGAGSNPASEITLSGIGRFAP